MMGRWVILGLTAVSIPFSFVAAPYPQEQALQHVPTVLALISLAILNWSCRVSLLSFASMIVFLWIHIFGARWIYSFVPYDKFIETLTGQTLSAWFGWQRNHYDRMVHFASGLLGVAPASELLQRTCGVRPLAGALLGISVVLSVGAVYEVIEWQIAISFSAAQAEAYNGQQGDVWDPQKDLALAGLGSAVAAGLLFRWSPPESSADS